MVIFGITHGMLSVINFELGYDNNVQFVMIRPYVKVQPYEQLVYKCTKHFMIEINNNLLLLEIFI